MSIAYPQKASSEQPFPVAGRFWQSIPAGVCKVFHSGGHRAVLRGAYMHVATCIAPGGVCRLYHWARAGRLNCSYICDEKILLLHRSPLKRQPT